MSLEECLSIAHVPKIPRNLWLDWYIRVEHGEDDAICETNVRRTKTLAQG